MMTPDLYFWTRLLVRLAVEAACVVGIALLMDRLIRPSYWRRALWQSAAVCLLLLTVSELSGFGRGLASYLFGHARQEQKVAAWTPPAAAAPLPSSSPSSSPLPAPPPPRSFAPASVSLPPPAVEAGISRPVWWPGLIWLGGGLVILGRVGVAHLLFISLRRRRPHPAHGDLNDRADAILQRLAVRRKIRVLQSPGLTGPLAFGILRPSVGLPADFGAKFSRAEQDAMLAHELAHLAAHDPLWYLLADVCSAALWWQPLAWWARLRLHRASELAADEAAALFPDGPAALAGCLVTLGKQMTQLPAAGWMGVEGGGFRSNLAERVQRLLRLADTARQPSYGWRAHAARLGAIFAISAAAVGLTGCLQSRGAVKQPTLQANLSQSWDASPAATVWHSALPAKTPGPPAPKPVTVVQVKLDLGAVASGQPAIPTAPAANRRTVTEANVASPRQETPAQTADGVGQQPPVPLSDLPLLGRLYAAANPGDASKGREAIVRKLQSVKLREVPPGFEQGLPLTEVLKILTQLSTSNDVDHTGVNFLFNPRVGGNAAGEMVDASIITIKITPPLRNVNLLQLLDAIRQMADQPLDFSVSDYAVWFFVKPPATATLESRLQPFAMPVPGTTKEYQDVIGRIQDLKIKEQPSGFEQGLPLTEVLKILNQLSISNAVDHAGVNFLFNPRGGSGAAGEMPDPSTITIKITPPLKNVTLLQLLDAIRQMADQPLSYAVEDYAVWFFVKPPELAGMETRRFHVDPNTFIKGLQGVASSLDVEQANTTGGGIRAAATHPTTDAQSPYYHYVTNLTADAQAIHYITTNSLFTNNMMVTRYFGSLGINLTNTGAFALFNLETGEIAVRNTAENLDKVERAIAQLNKAPPQVLLNVKVASAPTGFLSGPVFNVDTKDITISPSGTHGGAAPSFQTPPATTNPSAIFPAVYNRSTRTNAVVFRGLILDAAESRLLLTTIERQTNANILACPRITTESGGQAHVAVGDIVGDWLNGTPASAISREVPAVEILPTISHDGSVIHLVAIPSVTEFFGYDNVGQLKPETWAGDDRPFPPVQLPLPTYRVRQTVIETNVLDGQTLVLRALPTENATNQNAGLLIFITPTIIDPAGNRLHADGQKPAVPPQPGRSPAEK